MKLERFLLGIDHPEFRMFAEETIRAAGKAVITLPSSDHVCSADISGALLVLDTNDDHSKMRRVVDDIYNNKWSGISLPIFGIISYAEFLDPYASWDFMWSHRGVPTMQSIMPRSLAALHKLLVLVETPEMPDGGASSV